MTQVHPILEIPSTKTPGVWKCVLCHRENSDAVPRCRVCATASDYKFKDYKFLGPASSSSAATSSSSSQSAESSRIAVLAALRLRDDVAKKAAAELLCRLGRRGVARKVKGRLFANIRLVQSALYPLWGKGGWGGKALTIFFVVWSAAFKAWLLFLLINALITSEDDPKETVASIDLNFLDYALSTCGSNGPLPTSFCDPPGQPCNTNCDDDCNSARDLTGKEPAKVIRQFMRETKEDTLKPQYTTFQNFPYYEGMFFNVLTKLHLILCPVLFISAWFAVFETVYRSRMMSKIQSMTAAEAKKELAASLCGIGFRTSVLHHHLLAVQISIGLTAASAKFLKRGADVLKWVAVRPGFSLCLYLQFMCIASLCIDATVQYVYMSVHGFRKFPKVAERRDKKKNTPRWEPIYFSISGGATITIQILCTYIYCVYVNPYDEQIAYLIVFCLQVPVFFFYALENSYFWFENRLGFFHALDLNKQLVTWLNILTRHCSIMPYLSITTTLANVALRVARADFKYSLGPAVVYAVGDVLLVGFVFYLEAVRSSVMLKQAATCRGCCGPCIGCPAPCKDGCCGPLKTKGRKSSTSCNYLLSFEFLSRLGALLVLFGSGAALFLTLTHGDREYADVVGAC